MLYSVCLYIYFFIMVLNNSSNCKTMLNPKNISSTTAMDSEEYLMELVD